MLVRHPGQAKTYKLITCDYWWPRLRADITKYVSGCETCQRTKTKRTVPHAPLVPNEIPTRPWEIVSVDLIGPLTESQGHDMILVIVDRMTKAGKFIPVSQDITSLGVAREFRDHVFKEHGIPKKVISDRGPQFVAGFFKELFGLLGIMHNMSTAYHPQTDGQTKCMNQEIEQYLRIYINYHQDNWADWIAITQFSYNDKVHSATGYSLFYMNYGQNLWKGTEPHQSTKRLEAKSFAEQIQMIREEAEVSLKVVVEQMKEQYN